MPPSPSFLSITPASAPAPTIVVGVLIPPSSPPLPVLAVLLPTIVVGPALGAAAVYVFHEDGDLTEARSRVERSVRHVRGEVQGAVR